MQKKWQLHLTIRTINFIDEQSKIKRQQGNLVNVFLNRKD